MRLTKSHLRDIAVYGAIITMVLGMLGWAEINAKNYRIQNPHKTSAAQTLVCKYTNTNCPKPPG